MSEKDTGNINEIEQLKKLLKETKEKYSLMFKNMLNAFAYHKVITDENNYPIDYIILETNDAFEKFTGLKSDVIGKLITKVLPGIENDPSGWIQLYGEVALNGIEKRFESFSELLNKWYSVYVYSPQKGFFVTIFEEITEQKLAEEALVKKQFYLSKAQEIGRIGTWELDIPNNKLYWTKQNYKNFGLEYGTTLTYEIFLNCIHPDDRDYVNGEWSAAMDGKPYDIEHRVVTDGKVTWLREKADIKFDKNGKAISAIGVTQDITSFKESELNLKENERKFRILADNTSDWEYWLNENNEYVFISPTCKQITGYSKEDFYKNPDLFLDLVREDYRKEVTNHYYNEEKTEPSHNSEFPIINKNQKEVWIEHSCIPIFDEDGKFLGRRGNNRDITDKKNAENELIRTESIQRKMVSNIGDVIVISDKDGINRYKSPNVKKHFGWEVNELVGKSTWDRVHPEDVDEIKKILSSLASEPNKTVTTEMRYLHKNGEYRWIQIKVLNLLHDPEINGFLGNYHDVTEKKKNENLLIESQERLEIAQSTANIGSWEMNVHTKKLIWSKQMYDLLEVNTDQEPTFELYYSRIHPDDLDYVTEIGARVYEENEPAIAEYRLLLPSKKIKFIYTEGRQVLNESNDVIKLTGIVQDITERKKSEKELLNTKNLLEENNKLLIKIAENYPNSYVSIIEKDLTVGFSGGQQFTKLNLNPNDFFGLNLQDVFKDLASEVKKYYLKTFAGEETTFELFIDNQYQLYKTVPLYNEEKEINQILVVVENITERINTQHLIQHQASLIEQVDNAIITIDFNNTILSWNRHAEKLYQWKSKEAIGKNIIDLLAPKEVYFETTKNFEDLNRDGHWEGEYYVLRKDGTTVPAHITNTYLKDEKGNNVGFIGISTDITKRIEYENELIEAKIKAEESEEQYKLIAENASDVVWIIDFETNKLKYVSPSIKLQRGYTQEEAMTQSFNDYLTPDSLEYFSSKIPERIERFKQGISEYFNDELEQFCKDGSTIWTEVKAKYVKNKKTGKVETVGVTRDISEQKKAKNELEQYQKNLEELVKERTKELEGKNKELEKFNDLFIGREFRIKELRDKIKELEKRLP